MEFNYEVGRGGSRKGSEMSEATKIGELIEAHVKRNASSGEYEAEARFEPSEGTKILASFAYDVLREENAPNFFTIEAMAPEGMRISITVQRMAYDAETPSSKLAKMALENAALKKELEVSRSPREDRNQ